MYLKKIVTADNSGITEMTQFVRDHLKELKLKEKDIERIVLAVEEVAGSLFEHTAQDKEMSVKIISFLGKVEIEVASKGEKYPLIESMNVTSILDEEIGEAAQVMIRSILLKSMAGDIKYRHVGGTNRVWITGTRSKRAFLYQTLGAMALAIITGLILSMLGYKEFDSGLDTYVLVPVKTMYMNALKMVVAPVVFFSIVSCIVKFSDISELGRIGARVLSMYLLTTLIAVAIGICSFGLFKPGSSLPSEAALESAKDITSKTVDVSIKDMIVGIVPSDFLEPFVESNMLQLIFLAVICGIAAGLIGRYSEMVKQLFEAFNDLFLKITTMIIKFMPIAVFCSICSMMINMGIEVILSIFGIFATFLFGLLGMMIVYSILIIIIGKTNPLPFLRKYPPTMIQVFSMASSNAAIPINMEACERLGIAQKIYSLSVPLGATVNMDGTCVYMAVFALALAKTYGVSLSGASIAGIVLSIIVLSVGAPGIPGSGLICLSVLLAQLGVPVEAVGLVMGIDPLIGMFRSMSNCTGDVAVSVAAARLEGMLDMEKYRE